MNIPNSITLMGHKIDIVWDDTLVHEKDALGLADYRINKIRLQPSTDVYPIPRSVIEQAYIHEVVHYILHMLHEHDLRSDEKLVDNIAGLLYQALKDDKEKE